MSLPVIVTRTLPGAHDTAARLTREGYTPLLSPLLTVVAKPRSHMRWTAINDIVFTSSNGVAAFADTGVDPAGRTAWCVGAATADAAVAAGFSIIVRGNGNGDDLARQIIDDAPHRTRRFLHVANTAAAGNLVEQLNRAGIAAAFLPLYTTLPAAGFTPAAAAALAGAEPVCVLIHSAKAADVFCSLVADWRGHIRVAAISARAAAPLNGLGLARVAIAERPNEDALFDALAGLAGTSV